MNEAGFYKRDPDSGELLYAPNAVYGQGFTLLAAQHAEYSYPVDGWAWFESREEAEALTPAEPPEAPPEPA
jgi:hypothetical protein